MEHDGTSITPSGSSAEVLALSEGVRERLHSSLRVARALRRERGARGTASIVLACTEHLPTDLLQNADSIAQTYEASLSQREVDETITGWNVEDIARDPVDARAYALASLSFAHDIPTRRSG